MEVADWLRALGLERYEPEFRANHIGPEILPSLTVDDLKELGVASVGHRRRLLQAIAVLHEGGPEPRREQGRAPEPSPGPPPLDAERRQLTVMFCDLVGSTAIASRLDPEDLRELMGVYRACLAEVVGRSQGFIAQHLGDGAVAYFGYPQAHENDAEQAVRAGLAVAAAVAGLRTAHRLQVRVGIATGLVVVGELLGRGQGAERGVVGETPNLAARLQELAEPNTVVIGEATRRLVGSLFDLVDLGPQRLKGLADSRRAWRVAGESRVASRFEALRSAETPLVGREEELELLLTRWRQARLGEGQAVLLCGEPGIGKSRMTAVLQERIASEPHRRMRYFCSPYHADSPLHPVLRHIERVCRFSPDDTGEARLVKLEALLAQSSQNLQDDAAVLGELLTLPVDLRYPARTLSPQQKKDRILAALLVQLVGLASRRPLLVLFEDVHWIDPTTRELLEQTVERIESLPVLLLITFRPEFQPPWVGQPHVTMHPFRRLTRRHSAEMIERVAGSKRLPPDVADRIAAHTDGVPLFIEELTKTVLESALLGEEAGQSGREARASMLAIPTTLRDSLMARLDRLAPARELAQIGAVIGREFSYGLLRAAAAMPDDQLRDGLIRLTASELIFARGSPPDAVYAFKHALVQDAAYALLLKGRRQRLHERIARALEAQFPATAAAEPEVVAQHFAQADLPGPAVDWFAKAGDLALHRSAFAEAIQHFGKAIELADGMEDGQEQRLLRLRLQIGLGQALMSGRGQGDRETTAAFVRARQLAGGIGDAAERFSALYGLWASSYIRGELPEMEELAFAFLREVEDRPGVPEAGVAHRVSGATCWFRGDFATARRHLEMAIAAYEPARDQGLSFRFGQDVGVAAMGTLAMALWPLGEVDRAREAMEEAMRLATAGAHAPSIAYALGYAQTFEAFYCRDPARALRHAEASVRLGREHQSPLWFAYGTVVRDWARSRTAAAVGQPADLRETLAFFREQGVGALVPAIGVLQADLAIAAEQVEAALADVDEHLREADRMGQHWIGAELHRQRAELLLRRAPPDHTAAEAAFRQAIAIARNQRARAFELRAALGLARLCHATGDADAGRALLSPALSGFSETPAFPDVAEANRLIAAAV